MVICNVKNFKSYKICKLFLKIKMRNENKKIPAAVTKLSLKYDLMSEGNVCITASNLELLP